MNLARYRAALLFILVAHISGIFSQGWKEPFFLEIEPPQPIIQFNDSTPNGRIIFLDEEVPASQDTPLYIAEINYDGPEQLTITRVQQGFANYLGGVILQKDGKSYFAITEKQDYEVASMQRYHVEIKPENPDQISKTVFLNINNIDDNAPIIQINTCEVPELYLGLTNCSYNVNDVDGRISIDYMTYKIEGRAGEENLFEVKDTIIDDYNINVELKTISELDYYKSKLHIFTLIAMDSLPNKGEASPIVQVLDVPNRDPEWKTLWAMQRFDEKTAQRFLVEAVDGDTQINKKIMYKLKNVANPDLFSIGPEDGIVDIQPIDRDGLNQDVFTFDVSAYKFDNESWETTANLVIIVNDINDNPPRALNHDFSLDIPEETYLSLDFDPLIIFEDIDLGINAQYTVELKSVDPAGCADAFLIIPNAGYQKQEFKLSIVNASMLDYDYESPPWRTVKFEIIATEIVNTSHCDIATITINLENWNDELPIFLKFDDEVEFEETVGKGHLVNHVEAKDRDIGDLVVHSLVGSVNSFLAINESTGEIVVSVDDAFDYQRSSEIVVQVMAKDTLGEPLHTTYAQFTIHLIDVNNKPPEIRMPVITPEVDENVPEGHLLTDEIRGSDPDSDAIIVFSINWTASYAMKQGRRTPKQEYEGCAKIDTKYEGGTRNARGVLTAKEIRQGVTIDFEMFEVLYLTIGLNDTMSTGDGYVEGVITIVVNDLNDNKPQWVGDTLTTKRVVREEADEGFVVGSLQAIDHDGPQFNVVRYYLKAINGTPEDLISLDAVSGQLDVLPGNGIDADTPKRFHLYYEVRATDCVDIDPPCWNTTGQIEIDIIDTNNKVPYALVDEFEQLVEIEEHSTSGNISILKSNDLDRDERYHAVGYTIDYKTYPELRKYFSVDFDSGLVYVDLQADADMDRDNNPTPYYDIHLILSDNKQIEGDRVVQSNETKVHVVLIDINDNPPVLPPSNYYSWNISENTAKNIELAENVTAPDIDQPNHPNSHVHYQVLSIEATDPLGKPPLHDAIDILSPNNVSGVLYTTKPLKGRWGTYDIWLKAQDHGVPVQSTNRTYTFIVSPYNYMKPEIKFPTEGAVLRLSKESAEPNSILKDVNGNELPDFKADDTDGLHAGDVTFEIRASDAAVDLFTIRRLDRNVGRLLLKKGIGNGPTHFDVNMTATDGGTDPGPWSSSVKFQVIFVTTKARPIYEQDTFETQFTEFEEGLSQEMSLLNAIDPKNEGCKDDCKPIYYYIMDGANANLFNLKSESNRLSLRQQLNRSEAEQHILQVAATNSPQKPNDVPEESVLTVTVKVKEADPKPRFEKSRYTAGITVTDKIGKELLTMKAKHSENLVMTYAIQMETMICHESLESVKEKAFDLNKDDGKLKLNFQPQEGMKGMFEFDCSAIDSDSKMDVTQVKIFLVADNNRISFIFDNTVEQIESKRTIIADIFTETFQLMCNIDFVVKANENGAALDDKTEVKTHFIGNDDLAVEAEAIEQQKSDVYLMRMLRERLRNEELELTDMTAGNEDDELQNHERTLRIVLIILAGLLSVALVALLVIFFIRTRSLNRRLKALSTTKFGSQDSGLNRIGVAVVPGTNKHAVEGSNPVWNEEIKTPQFDTISNNSGDSDLIGIEDNPQFTYENQAHDINRI